ncbi:MAG: methyltransferase domain-containing protein [Candidatus Diapherotrites archaeon]
MVSLKENTEKLFFPSHSSLEQATPKTIAFYRAKRLKCCAAIDLCCGIGVDAIALAKNCEKVFAVETDKNVLECAKKNAEAEKIENIEFLNSDCFDVNLKSLNVEIAFADPSRRTKDRRVKGLDETKPSTKQLVRFLEKNKIEDFCIEVSRELSPEEIPFNCEREYISLNGELNCVSLYFGSLKKCERSAVSLPAGEIIESQSLKPKPFIEAGLPKKFLLELDEAIVKSRLQAELLEKLGKNLSVFSENFFTSCSIQQSAFFVNCFEVLKEVKEKDLVAGLKALGAGRIVLRGRFDSRLQALAKKEIEAQLSGKGKFHVLNLKNKVFICRLVQS